MPFSMDKLALKEISIVVSICSLAVKIVFAKISFINVFIGKLQDPNAVLHSAAPVAFVLCPREKVVSPIAIYLVIDEAA